ncbi:ATP-binding cassette domain-containing protein, partial [Pseudoalteromonas sp. SIMBA_153]
RGPGLERGIVFQDHRLFPWMTLQQNIALALKNHALPAAEKNRLVAEHIELVGLSGYEQAYPHQLSGGQQQRVSIARALMNGGHIILADEPTGNLDPDTAHDVLALFRAQSKATGAATIMVTHSQAAAAIA